MTLLDITNNIYRRTKTNSSSFTAANMLIAINEAMNHVTSLILRCDSKWQFEDSNYTDLPIATTPLVANQKDYGIAVTHLTIDRVQIKDASGNWHELTQLDQQDLKRDRGVALDEYKETAGVPEEYDLIGNSLFLYPTPSYSQAASLKIYFTRPPYPFTSDNLSTGTMSPGFNSLFHSLIPLWVSYNYAVENGLQSANGFFAEIQRKEQEMYDFYGLRNRDMRPRLSVSSDTNK